MKEKYSVVYATFAKQDSEMQGFLKVATNDEIPVTVNGHLVELDIGGYFVVHQTDLEAFLDAVQKDWQRSAGSAEKR